MKNTAIVFAFALILVPLPAFADCAADFAKFQGDATKAGIDAPTLAIPRNQALIEKASRAATTDDTRSCKEAIDGLRGRLSLFNTEQDD